MSDQENQASRFARDMAANAEKMLADYRAEAAAELAAVRADLRARAERAEAEADAYRAELAQLRASAVNEPPATGGKLVQCRPRQLAQHDSLHEQLGRAGF